VAIASQSTRLDLNLGVDETLWLVNMFGPGMALDLVAPSTMGGEGVSVHFRIEPNFAVRVKRLGDVGALAVRIGVPYDSHYQWGLQLGVTLQMKGVPGFTEAAE
jgi:hypothetical protein